MIVTMIYESGPEVMNLYKVQQWYRNGEITMSCANLHMVLK